ncbi:hypothetical protein AGMMS50239_34790 [Bacteroidia bacterium]|nr:hypothetical protein AGMMS50239_34790 [Bacteroidia bacterium]
MPNLKEVEALYNVGMLGFYPVNILDPNPDLYYWSSTETADYASYGYYFTSFNPNTPPSFGESVKNQSNTWGTYVARCVRRNPAGVCPAPVAILTGDASTAKQKVLSQKAIFNITYNLFSVESVEVIGLPAGITAARKGNTLTISGTAPDYDLMSEKTIDYKVILTNACGTKTTGSAGSIEVIESTVEGDSGTKYKVYSYPDGIGVWMIENLKENTGSPTMTTYSGQSEGERGYYYPSDDARTACPQGYELPTVQQVEKLRKYINSGEATAEEMDHWFSESAHAGYYWQYDSSWQDWGNNGYWWIADFYFVPYAFGADTGNINEINQMNGGPIDDYILPVRCVKSEK